MLKLSEKDKYKNDKRSNFNICLNDQGGFIMNVTFGITSTLRSETHQHPPLVLDIKDD